MALELYRHLSLYRFLAVFCAIRWKRVAAKTPSHFYVSSGHIGNNISMATPQSNVNPGVDQNGYRNSLETDSCGYDSIPDEVTPYVQSYRFEVPQYDLCNIPSETGAQRRKKHDTNSLRGYANKMAAGQVVNNTTTVNVNQTKHFDDEKGSSEESEDESIYESVPPKIHAYVKSYACDTPQYNPGNTEVKIRAMGRKQIDKNASDSHVQNMAAAQFSTNTPKLKVKNSQRDQFDDQTDCGKDLETGYESHVYETIPKRIEAYRKPYTFDIPPNHSDDTGIEPDYATCSYDTVPKQAETYRKSYTFDVPQYHLGDVADDMKAKRRKHPCKNAPGSHMHKTTAGQFREDLESDYASCTYETVPKEVEAYGKSYTFDVPQYHLGDDSVDIKAIRKMLDRNASHTNVNNMATASDVNSVSQNDQIGNDAVTDSDYYPYETVP
ncbi:PREDICTED: uncharacterized protein LOC109476483 [Branchiostoma belcheri]|uniref:Uncharacterized protein LOC109476483 n=1 Tax=Branchiostoma belcheri TaxID=7741 RepID=A0A6P4Z8I2_BRABE|nr:PREDICTED: uncharacterized protein LOC109476483 [Branchiostoma belcheri]